MGRKDTRQQLTNLKVDSFDCKGVLQGWVHFVHPFNSVHAAEHCWSNLCWHEIQSLQCTILCWARPSFIGVQNNEDKEVRILQPMLTYQGERRRCRCSRGMIVHELELLEGFHLSLIFANTIQIPLYNRYCSDICVSHFAQPHRTSVVL